MGRLPYRISRRSFGTKVLDMPTMVHVLGPAIAAQFAGTNFPRSLKELSVLADLIAQLPAASHITFRLHAGLTNTLAFDVAGFTSRPSYSIEIKPETQEVLWKQLRDKTRNVIRRAEECLQVETLSDAAMFLDFYEDNLEKAGRSNIYRHDVSLRLLQECLRRGVGRILVAKDVRGCMQSAVFTVWDAKVEYYFMSTRRAESVNGATCLLIWNALQAASEAGRTFDMDGIHIVNNSLPNLLLLTGFGGVMTPRYVVTRSSSGVQLVSAIREYVGKVGGAALRKRERPVV